MAWSLVTHCASACGLRYSPKSCLTWSNSCWNLSFELWGFVWRREIWHKVVSYMKYQLRSRRQLWNYDWFVWGRGICASFINFEGGVWSWEKDFSQEGRRETNQLWSYARRSGGVSTWMGPFFSLELKHRKSVPIFEIGYTAILQRHLQLIWSQSWASGGRRLSRSHDYEETTGDQAKRAMRWTIHHALRACT